MTYKSKQKQKQKQSYISTEYILSQCPNATQIVSKFIAVLLQKQPVVLYFYWIYFISTSKCYTNHEQIKLVVLGSISDLKDDTLIGYIPYYLTFLNRNNLRWLSSRFDTELKLKIYFDQSI